MTISLIGRDVNRGVYRCIDSHAKVNKVHPHNVSLSIKRDNFKQLQDVGYVTQNLYETKQKENGSICDDHDGQLSQLILKTVR